MDLVYIEWDDAEDFSANGSAWASQQEAEEFSKKVYIVRSVGWVVKKTRHYLSIASDHDPNHGNYGTLRKVPRKMIKRLDILSIPQKEERLPEA